MSSIVSGSSSSSSSNAMGYRRSLALLILIALYAYEVLTLEHSFGGLQQAQFWQWYESSITATTTAVTALLFHHENNSHTDTPRRSTSDNTEQKNMMMIQTDHAIVVPYRNREKHLQAFKKHMVSYMSNNTKHDNMTFSLWIIEQDDDAPFNRAWLTNVGISQATQAAINLTTTTTTTRTINNCIILHDVDLIPLSPTVPYSKCDFPIQLGSELQSFRWGIPYNYSFGGVVSMSANHWQLVNGMSNGYAGWGAEDDDLYRRVATMGLFDANEGKKPYRPPIGHGRFGTIDQSKEHHVNDRSMLEMNRERLKKMRLGQLDWKNDGLNSLQYTVTNHEMTSTIVQAHDNDDDGDNNNKNNHGLVVIHHVKVKPSPPPPPPPPPPTAALAAPIKKNKLEFVHITNTGGLAIEKAAATQAGIAWGACHYANGNFKAMGCPIQPPDLEGKIKMNPNGHPYRSQSMSRWHVPLQYLTPHPFPATKTFTVVRHPYDRAIEGYKGSSHDELHFNEWIQQKAKQQDIINLAPQSTYVFHVDGNGTRQQMVDHVLHYEQLPETFNALMADYQLNITLPSKKKFHTNDDTGRMTRFNFTTYTIELLNDIFKQDFANFGYERMSGA